MNIGTWPIKALLLEIFDPNGKGVNLLKFNDNNSWEIYRNKEADLP